MNDYLEPYEDMSAYSFAVAEKFVEPITNALCKTMGFVFDRKEKRKSCFIRNLDLQIHGRGRQEQFQRCKRGTLRKS